MPVKAATWGARRSRSSSRCSRACVPRACTWSGRCRPTRCSCRTRWRRVTRRWPCTTTRACPCSSTRASAAGSTSRWACPSCGPRSITARRSTSPAADAPIRAACSPRWNWPWTSRGDGMTEHRARKRFGQNFLSDPNIIRKIVDAIRPQPGETMVEIGPGLGAMTDPIVERVGHLHVVEIDRDLIARLKSRYGPDQLTIHEGDALAFDFASLGTPLRVVGNLPYNISTPLLFHLATFADGVRDMHFMLQKEVVLRMT